MKKHTLISLPLLIASSFSGAALAHVAYLKPLQFEPVRGGKVTLDASFAEQFFVPEAAITNASFEVVTPSGKQVSVEKVVDLSTRNVLEHTLEEEGTYQFSTGKRMGAIFRVYEKDGERGSMRGNEKPLPEGAILKEHFQSVTFATTYVTKKGPSEQALAPRNDGLEIVAVNHPNSLFANESFNFKVLFNGKPVTDHEISVYQGKDQFAEESDVEKLTTNAKGQASFTPSAQDVYLMQV
ncbi:MAG: DUF4198 domain-containing protein [Pseudomonadota bacterium]|nr:DUF4198 domain-containing protein [Pseudomonadota bacterium]